MSDDDNSKRGYSDQLTNDPKKQKVTPTILSNLLFKNLEDSSSSSKPYSEARKENNLSSDLLDCPLNELLEILVTKKINEVLENSNAANENSHDNPGSPQVNTSSLGDPNSSQGTGGTSDSHSQQQDQSNDQPQGQRQRDYLFTFGQKVSHPNIEEGFIFLNIKIFSQSNVGTDGLL